MQVSELLKQTIEALPGEQFTQAWKCVEEIDAALNKAGPTALLAASYCRAVHEERHAQLVMIQQGRIANLVEQFQDTNDSSKRGTNSTSATTST